MDLPFILGYDLVGTVDKLGPNVTAWQVGDRVADLTVIGGNAQYVCRPADSPVAVPDAVSATDAVAICNNLEDFGILERRFIEL